MDDDGRLAALIFLLGITVFVNAYILAWWGFGLTLERAVTSVPVLVQLLVGAILMLSALAMLVESAHITNFLMVAFAVGILAILVLAMFGVMRLTLQFILH